MLRLSGPTLQVTETNGKSSSYDVSSGCQAIPADLQAMVAQTQDVHKQCMELESAIAGMESLKGHGPYFPIIICRSVNFETPRVLFETLLLCCFQA